MEGRQHISRGFMLYFVGKPALCLCNTLSNCNLCHYPKNKKGLILRFSAADLLVFKQP
jgi:hypothetical protein